MVFLKKSTFSFSQNHHVFNSTKVKGGSLSALYPFNLVNLKNKQQNTFL